uniref:Uncharacterized protein n=1 Tax=Medicago truncatula TaxID=3880 RepID=I3SLB2_MEDTR|nr:unknown [Medicago truncatula]
MISGIVPVGICELPNLVNFTFSYNFFCEEEGICENLTSKKIAFDDRRNCLPEKALQRSEKECSAKLEHPVDCFELCCVEGGLGNNVSAGFMAIPPSATASAAMPLSAAPLVAPSHP